MDSHNLQGKKIFIAGGTGLVGSNVTRKVKDLGANVLSSYYEKAPSLFKEIYRRFDFTRFEDCIEATKNMDYVVMCVARVFGSKTMKENPSIALLPNLKINAGLLEACRINKVEKVIVISSSTVYQEAGYPIREDQLDLNSPPYAFFFGVGWMNRYLEQLARFYFERYGMQIGVLRPTNIYGPYDKFDDETSHVLPALIKRALKKETPFVVWGDGSAVRDFIYVEDFVDDLLDVLDSYCICEPLNIASAEPITIKVALEVILNVCKHTTVVQYDASKPRSIPYRVLDTSKFDSVFGKKKRTSLSQGIKKTVEWYQSIDNKVRV